MLSDKYSEVYLQSFYNDLDSLMYYIAYKLENPKAAKKLYHDVFNATESRMKAPLAFESMYSKKHRELPYYRIYVNNFTIYYVVDAEKVEFRRILYKKRNLENL